jgi:hypothetical protein
MGDRYTLAHKLLDQYPSKAVELLMDHLRDDGIRAATERYIGQTEPTPARHDAALEQRPGSSSAHIRRPSSSLPQRMTRQNMPDGRHTLHTPSNSAGSVKSHASSLAAAAGMERIYLMSDDESDDQPVTSIRAPGRYNLIGDQVVYDRGFGASQVGVEESVSVQHQSGKQRLVTAKRAVNITWRRRNELRSRLNTFYVVPADMLDSDVLLASDEYVEHESPSGQSTTVRRVCAQQG